MKRFALLLMVALAMLALASGTHAIASRYSGESTHHDGNGSGLATVKSQASISTISVGSNPVAVAYDPANHDIYVVNTASCGGCATVSVIDSSTNTVVSTICGSADCSSDLATTGRLDAGGSIAYDPSNSNMYLTASIRAGSGCSSGSLCYTETNAVLVIDSSTNAVTATVLGTGLPCCDSGTISAVAYNPTNEHMYIPNNVYSPVTGLHTTTVSVVDSVTNTITATIDLAGWPSGIAYNPTNHDMYVGSIYPAGSVFMIDSSSNTVVRTITGLGQGLGGPYNIAFDPANGDIYVSNGGGWQTQVISSSTNDIVHSIDTMGQDSGGGSGLAYNPANQFMYNSNLCSSCHTVQVIDSSTNSVVDTIDTGHMGPWGIAYNPQNNYMYVADRWDGTVSVISTVPVAPNPTTTAVDCSPSPVIAGVPAACTGSVTDTSTSPVTPSGSVSFTSDAGSTFFSATNCALSGTGASANCQVSYAQSPYSGTPTITGSYEGDSSHASSSGQFVLTVTPRTTSTSVSCVPSDISLSRASACTATVTDTSPGTHPDWTVRPHFTSSGAGIFGDGTVDSDTCYLSSGSPAYCSVTYTPTAVGTGIHTVQAIMGADGAFLGSSDSFDIIVNTLLHPNTTHVSCESPVVANQASTCAVTVTDTFSTPTTPTGNVDFTVFNGGLFSSCNLAEVVAGVSSCLVTYTQSVQGTALITGSYAGDSSHATSSGQATISIDQRTTTIFASCIPGDVSLGQASVCTAIVTDTSLGTHPVFDLVVRWTSSGTGTFSSDLFGDPSACQFLQPSDNPANCSVSYTPSAAGTGTHSIQARTSETGTFAVSSDTFDLTVISAVLNPTTTSISCDSPVAWAQASTCAVTVRDTSSNPTTPTGSVSLTSSNIVYGLFSSSGCNLSGTTSLASCQVTYTQKVLTGTDTITAAYGGDLSHAESSGHFDVTSTARTTTTSISCVPSTVPVSQPTLCNATVSDTSPGDPSQYGFSFPQGPVTFTSDGAGTFTPENACFLLPGAGTASCSVTYTPSGLGTGTHTITASYNLNSYQSGWSQSSDNFPLTVTPAATTTTTVSCDTPVVWAELSSCVVTVIDISSNPTTPSGSVSLTSNNAYSYFGSTTCSLSGTTSSGTCQVTYASVQVGTNTITAVYPGDSSHAISSGQFNVASDIRTTTTSLTCDPNAVNTGQASTCTVTVTDISPGNPGLFGIGFPQGYGSFTGSGDGTFSAPSGSPGVCSLDGPATGTAICSILYTPSAVGTGTHTITATYQPFAAWVSSSVTFDLAVTAPPGQPTTTSLSCDSPVALYQSSTCIVTVTDTSSGPTTPTGSVSFTTSSVAGSFSSNNCSLSGTTSSASCQVTYSQTAQSGTFTVTTSYAGDSSHRASSEHFDIMLTLRTSTTSVSCAPNSVNIGQASTCTVTVTDTSPGLPNPVPAVVIFASSGDGTFSSTTSSGGNVCGLAGTGTTVTCFVTYTPSSVGLGTHTITASFGNIEPYDFSQGTFELAVAPIAHHPTSIIISCETPVVVNQASTCKVTVMDTSTSSATTPSGSVTFRSASSVPGSLDTSTCDLVVGATGTASCSVHFVPLRYDLGPASVSASYDGDSTHNGTTSSVFDINVNGRSAITTVACDSPVTSDGSSSCTVTVTDTDTAGTPLTPYGNVGLSTNNAGAFSDPTHNCNISPGGASASCSLLGSGASASVTIIYSPTVAGGHRITGDHLSDGYHLPSSGFFDISATPPALHNTTTTVFCETPLVLGLSSICTATVTDASSSPIAPTGTVTFTSAGSATGALSSSACTLSNPTSSTATCQVTFASSETGTADISGSYAGDLDHASSSSVAFSIVVNPRSTTTAINCDGHVTVDIVASCYVTVMDTSPGTPITPIGSLRLATNGTGVFSGPCNLTGTRLGTASCTVTYTPTVLGAHTITANYPGDASHLSSSNTFDIAVTVPADIPPVARFTTSATTAPVGTVISFDASTSSDPDGTLVAYAWDFGDGTTVNGVIVSHSYSRSGAFTVILTVTDNGGLTDRATSQLTIAGLPVARTLLTFRVSHADEFENGVGQLDVRVNGKLVVNVPAGLFNLTGTGVYAPLAHRWVSLGPFDINDFLVPGTNIVVFSDPLSSGHARVRDISIKSGNVTLLVFDKTRDISRSKTLTLTFTSPNSFVPFAVLIPETSLFFIQPAKSPYFTNQARGYSKTILSGGHWGLLDRAR